METIDNVITQLGHIKFTVPWAVFCLKHHQYVLARENDDHLKWVDKTPKHHLSKWYWMKSNLQELLLSDALIDIHIYCCLCIFTFLVMWYKLNTLWILYKFCKYEPACMLFDNFLPIEEYWSHKLFLEDKNESSWKAKQQITSVPKHSTLGVWSTIL